MLLEYAKMFANIHLCREARFCSRQASLSDWESQWENLASSNIYSRLMVIRSADSWAALTFTSCRTLHRPPFCVCSRISIANRVNSIAVGRWPLPLEKQSRWKYFYARILVFGILKLENSQTAATPESNRRWAARTRALWQMVARSILIKFDIKLYHILWLFHLLIFQVG